MKTVIGILLDVSGSMEKQVSLDTAQKSESWAQSIFQVVDNLIQQDTSSNNQVFAICYG